MSIAGIAKEVTTITVSAWFFGDQLTPLNITGVSITICGTSYPKQSFKWVDTVCVQASSFSPTTNIEDPSNRWSL